MSALTVKIPIKNKTGDVVGEREVVSYAGLLSLAHANGLESVETIVVQLPTEANAFVAIVRAVVVGRRGTYTGIGDADPTNVNRSVARHLLRIAETRAKARALRDMVSIGEVSIEELGGDEEDGGERPGGPSARSVAPDTSPPFSDAQRRVLWRQAAQMGFERDEAAAFITRRLNLRDGRPPTKREASRLIDELDAELRRGVSNGGRDHAA